MSATASVNRCAQLAEQLVDQSGLIAFHVHDVVPGGTLIVGAPGNLNDFRGDCPILVMGDCDNPTATYLSPAKRQMAQASRDSGNTHAVERAREEARDAKPLHKLWIYTKDTAVRDWAQGTHHTIRARVLSASLVPGGDDYIKADLVLRMEDQVADATSQPAELPTPTP